MAGRREEMRTPAGKECPHYYQDFHRGRNAQECRLAAASRTGLRWQPRDCGGCPVPDILNANSSPFLELSLAIQPRLLILGRKLTVEASCTRHRTIIEDPYIGCRACNASRPGLDKFLKAIEQDEEA